MSTDDRNTNDVMFKLNELIPNDIIVGNYKHPNILGDTVEFKAKVRRVDDKSIVGILIEGNTIEGNTSNYVSTNQEYKVITIDKTRKKITSDYLGVRTPIDLVKLIREGNTTNGNRGGKRSDIQKRSRKTRKSRKFKKQKGHNRRTRR